jgi:N-acetylglucosaminyl-diphospho-decaprenol L-rhamnosyltransferase
MRALGEADAALDITVIIISYNTRDMTVACIRSVLDQADTVRLEIIVLDNASTDGSAEAIRENFPGIDFIASSENLGFGLANNVAAMRAHGQRLLLLNPDTVILDHAIDRLNEFAMANPACRVWGGRTVFADGTLAPASCWGDATLWSIFCFAAGLTRLKQSSLFNPEGYGGWKRDTVRSVDIVTGCFLLIDRDLWQELRGFNPVFFMYGEDADLCLRARKLGARPTITPTATIIHHGGASEPQRAEQRIKVLAGRITLLQRSHSRPYALAGRLLYLILPLSRIVVYGAVGALPGNAGLRRTARNWLHVWRSRARWIDGWGDAAMTGAGVVRSPGFVDPLTADAGDTGSMTYRGSERVPAGIERTPDE